jgi:hypothetical protein
MPPHRALPHAVEEEVARLSDEVANAVAVPRIVRKSAKCQKPTLGCSRGMTLHAKNRD